MSANRDMRQTFIYAIIFKSQICHKNIIQKYNSIPLTNNVNPDLSDYVTSEALNGVYTMIAVEEKDIRNDISSRTTTLLKRVFSLQD